MTLPCGYVSTHGRHRSFNGRSLHIPSPVLDIIPTRLSKHFSQTAAHGFVLPNFLEQ